MAPDVDALISLTGTAHGLAIEARVIAERRRPMRWRLEVETRGQGGTSKVQQGGTTDGAQQTPVGSVVVSPPISGQVLLTVHEGEKLVAEERLPLPPK